ncbi:hypothetical protein AARAC_002062 [Aspergillus arachidicola]|uniref:Ankyrin repeat protein n=1 Tax=Aspergillus arachidicola TaxID=656916 RepID=A0A2G7G106_9EURO|nr:hypothetical protein AARAC_002062 [Aspergillus arachidicola]
MGWNLDYSALTPGPGGTVMLGEKGGAEAVARRAKEHRARERELAMQEGRLTDDAVSETTLVPQSTQSGSIGSDNMKPGSSCQGKALDRGKMAKAVSEGGSAPEPYFGEKEEMLLGWEIQFDRTLAIAARNGHIDAVKMLLGALHNARHDMNTDPLISVICYMTEEINNGESLAIGCDIVTQLAQYGHEMGWGNGVGYFVQELVGLFKDRDSAVFAHTPYASDPTAIE